MYHSNTNARTERFRQNPSFSTTLLEKIYRSIDEPESDKIKKQSSRTSKDPRTKQNPHRHHKDALFYSSNSSSSDSSSGGFSSSDTESMYGVKPRAETAFPPPPKPVRTTVPSRSEKCKRTEEKQRRVPTPLFDNYSSSQRFSRAEEIHDESIIKSKSRALRIYANLKKAKTPISPGGRLASFLNSLFTPGNVKKSKTSPSIHNLDDVNMDKSYQPSNCSSASSFSRSCLSKKSPGRRNAPKRSVRFYPVSEDLKPCSHKSLSEDSDRVLQSGRSCVRNDYLRDYLRNQKKSNSIDHYRVDEDEDEDDDASSCSSSDLFELDHLSVMGRDSRYREELPVYQTTHFRVQ